MYSSQHRRHDVLGTLRLGREGDRFGPLPARHQGLSGLLAQGHGVLRTVDQLLGWFGPRGRIALKVDRARQLGVRPTLRPDVQFRNPDRGGQPTYIEIDTDPRRMQAHIADGDRGVRRVYLLVDRHTGALREKRIYPAGQMRPLHGTLHRLPPLRREDVFDF